jgi:hypothetical protein
MVQEDADEKLSQDFYELPKAELVKIILQQQLRLKTLQTALHRLEQQRSGEEVSSPPHYQRCCPVNLLLSSQPQGLAVENKPSDLPLNNSLFPPVCAEIMLELGLQNELKQLTHFHLNEQKTKMERAIRNALRFLNDAVYLEHSPLIRVLAEMRQIKVDGRGLQCLLNQAIERLKPHPGQPGYHKWRIRYEILCLTYREQRPPQTVATALALSERQYYRELKEAVEGVINSF